MFKFSNKRAGLFEEFTAYLMPDSGIRLSGSNVYYRSLLISFIANRSSVYSESVWHSPFVLDEIRFY